MSGGVQTVSKKAKQVLAEFAEANGMSQYEAASMAIMDHCTGKCGKSSTNEGDGYPQKLLPNYQEHRRQLENQPTSELKKLFDMIVSSDKLEMKEKKNMAWMPDRFFHNMNDLVRHKAPPAEFVMFANRVVLGNMLAEILQQRGEGFAPVDWNKVHWDAAEPYVRDSKGNHIRLSDFNADVKRYSSSEEMSRVFER